MAYVAAKTFTFYGKRYRKGQEFKADGVKSETVEKLVKNGRIKEGTPDEDDDEPSPVVPTNPVDEDEDEDDEDDVYAY